MEGCGNFGLPVVDTSEQRVRVWYFPVVIGPWEEEAVHAERYRRLVTCAQEAGWRRCTHLGTLWLNQSF